MAGGHAALLQVLLVILFGPIECACRSNLRRDGPFEFAGGFERRPRLLGSYFLFRRMEENRRAVLRAEVWSLAVCLRGIVSLPKNVEQLFVTHFRRIERHLHDFRVASFIGADIFVGRILRLPAAVPHCRINHSWHPLKRRFDAPEAPRPKCRYFCHGHRSSLQSLPSSCFGSWMRELLPAILNRH